MAKYIVTMNGAEFATFPTKKWAEEYAMVQRCKIRGGGIAPSPDKIPDQKKAFAAAQKWEVKEG